MHQRPPFDRTICDCEECVQCCERQPGHLIPGDLERIAAHLGGDPEIVGEVFFAASKGALVRVRETGDVVRIGTITPATDTVCRFLDPATRQCRIHEVAPFGCAYFDTHMSAQEGHRRSQWGLVQIASSIEYQAMRAALPTATVWEPAAYPTQPEYRNNEGGVDPRSTPPSPLNPRREETESPNSR